MTITDLVAPEAILAALKVNSKKQAIQELAARAATLTGQNERAIFEVLLQREKLGTTAVGYGVAIPHGKLPKLEKLFGLFARLERPIDFEAMDGQPVDLVFLLLAPEGAGADHLKALQARRLPHPWLAGRALGMIFEKPSTRTRVSFEVGMVQLGGHAVHLSGGESQLGRGEPISDTGAVVSPRDPAETCCSASSPGHGRRLV